MRELNGWHKSVRTAGAWMWLTSGLLVGGGAAGAFGQDAKQVVVRARHPQVVFKVDGREFRGAASFLWPVGSKHVLEFPVRRQTPLDTTNCQYNDTNDSRFCFQGWSENSSLLQANSDLYQTVTVGPGTNWYEPVYQAQHILRVLGFEGTAGSETAKAAACGAPGDPGTAFRPGIFFIAGECYWNGFTDYYPEGELTLNAFPFPGFVFVGWSVNATPPNEYLRLYRHDAPRTIAARFTPAKRVMFRTSPPELKVMVDRALVSTAGGDDRCDFSGTILPYVPRTIAPLCLGDFDFAPNSRHVIGAPSPQVDRYGKLWVFDRFSNGMGDNSVLEVGAVTTNNQHEMIIAQFVRGVSTSITTKPTGLKVVIDGRDNYPNGYFVFAAGRKIQVSAPSEQVDRQGRRWVFKGWSNGGEQTQELTVPDQADGLAFSVIAEYEQLGQVTIRSNPVGNPVLVDGRSCMTPCTVDRPVGAEIVLSAPPSHALSDVHRMDFVSWSDAEGRERGFTFTAGETRQITANFRMAFKFSVTTDPEGAASVTTDPPSSDGFYPADTFLTVTARANPGFRFRRWGGDLSGSFTSATVMMSTARFATANLDRVPFISEAGIRNAAAVVPSNLVAPGSLIAITGANLAEDYVAGPQNPLSQSVGGVSVLVGSRILPLIFVSPEQINAQLPMDLEPGEYKLTVKRVGAADVEGAFQVAWCAPGLFEKTVEGQSWVVASHEDGSAVTEENPAKKGETITLTGTGFGRYHLNMLDGFAFPPSPEFRVLGNVEITAGELKPAAKWAGGLVGQTGTVGVKFTVPAELPSGAVPVKVSMEGHESNTALLPVRD